MLPLPKRFSLNFTVAIILSSLLHLSLLLLNIRSSKSTVAPSTPVVVEVALSDKGGDSSKTIKDKEDGKDLCPAWYGGIGITTGFNDTIDFVAKGYPAHRSGLLVGDVIPNSHLIRGEPGTQLVLLVVRGSKEFEVTLTREKICYD